MRESALLLPALFVFLGFRYMLYLLGLTNMFSHHFHSQIKQSTPSYNTRAR